MTYSTEEPWGGRLYSGISKPADTPQPDPRYRRIPRRRIGPAAFIGGGVAVALALGLGFGLLARPDLGDGAAPKPMQPVRPSGDTVDSRMSIEIATPAPNAAPMASTKLEVLPRGAVSGAPPSSVASAIRLPPPPPLPQLVADAGPAREAGPCGAGSPATRMVCADPDLTAADRAMSRAYRRAARSGVDPDQLRVDQRAWLAVREEAALRSPGAVASIYDQRIDELNQLAEDGPG